jgi:hypothetical protein
MLQANSYAVLQMLFMTLCMSFLEANMYLKFENIVILINNYCMQNMQDSCAFSFATT